MTHGQGGGTHRDEAHLLDLHSIVEFESVVILSQALHCVARFEHVLETVVLECFIHIINLQQNTRNLVIMVRDVRAQAYDSDQIGKVCQANKHEQEKVMNERARVEGDVNQIGYQNYVAVERNCQAASH